VRRGRRIPKESESQFQLDLVSGRRGVVPERRAGDASREFASGGGERGHFRGVFGCGDLLWTAGEAVLGAGERAGASGVVGFRWLFRVGDLTPRTIRSDTKQFPPRAYLAVRTYAVQFSR